MELLRYILVLNVIALGGGLLSGVLFFITLPLLSTLRFTTLGRIVNAVENGFATLVAVVAAFHLCVWTGADPSYGMFLLAFVAMVSNDLWRIRRAQSVHMFGGLVVDEESGMRAGMLNSERMNLIGDLLGFVVGLTLIPSLAIL